MAADDGALALFEAGLEEVRLLIDLREVGATVHDSTARTNALNRAAVVLLVSHFESFLKALAEEFVDGLDTGQVEARKIPRGIRELHTIPRMEELMACNDAAQRLTLLRKLQPLMSLWNDTAKPARGTLHAARLSRRVTNGDSQTIDALFELMGSPGRVCDGDVDIRSEDEPASLNIRLGLSDVVQCRNDIAHGKIGRLPTSTDVQRYITLLSALSARLSGKSRALLADTLA